MGAGKRGGGPRGKREILVGKTRLRRCIAPMGAARGPEIDFLPHGNDEVRKFRDFPSESVQHARARRQSGYRARGIHRRGEQRVLLRTSRATTSAKISGCPRDLRPDNCARQRRRFGSAPAANPGNWVSLLVSRRAFRRTRRRRLVKTDEFSSARPLPQQRQRTRQRESGLRVLQRRGAAHRRPARPSDSQ